MWFNYTQLVTFFIEIKIMDLKLIYSNFNVWLHLHLS